MSVTASSVSPGQGSLMDLQKTWDGRRLEMGWKEPNKLRLNPDGSFLISDKAT